MALPELPKLMTRVRFPSPAPDTQTKSPVFTGLFVCGIFIGYRSGGGTRAIKLRLLLAPLALPKFESANNHIGDKRKDEEHQQHPGDALQGFDYGAVDLQRPASNIQLDSGFA